MKSITAFRVGVVLVGLYFSGQYLDAQTPNWIWARSFGSTKQNDVGNGITANHNGEVYITGSLSEDAFIFKYDTEGNILWRKSIGGEWTDAGTGIVTDDSGYVYVTGFVKSSTFTFDSITITNPRNTSQQIFVAKLTADGKVIWVRSTGGETFDLSMGIAVDKEGNVYVTGYFMSPSIVFGTTTLYNSNICNTFVVKYDRNGETVWAKSAGGCTNCRSYGIATDSGGDVYITGKFQCNQITFGSYTITRPGGNQSPSVFVTKYDSDGNVIWFKWCGGGTGKGIAVDRKGNVYCTGGFNSTELVFDNKVLTLGTGDAMQMFLVKFDSDGNVFWGEAAGEPSGDVEGSNVSIDSNGEVYVVGDFACDHITFDSIALTNNRASYSDMFVVNYDTSGMAMWAKSAGEGNYFETGKAMVVDKNKNVFVIGEFGCPAFTLGKTTLINTGGFDIYFVKISESTVGGITYSLDSKANIAPNPSDGQVNITLPPGQWKMMIYTVFGNCIRQLTLDTPRSVVDLFSQPKGVYFYRLYNEQVIVKTGTIVIE